MRGGLAWLVVAALGSARGEANPAHPTKVRAGLALPPCDPLAPRPRVHVYNLPEDLTDAPNSERRWRSYAMFFARVRTSPFYEADGRCADYFLIPHRAFTFVTSKQPAMRGLAPRLFSFIAQRWPYWNASARVDSARHIIYSPCDYGPECLHVDKAYKSRSARRLPRAHPADRTRLVLHVELTGREDWRPSLDGGETCGRCFLPGVDIRLPSPPDHNCGPLCGYSHAVLVRNAIWGRPPAERRALLAARREHTFFFAGRSMHTGDARSLLRAHHAGRPGWRIGVSAGLGGRVSISDAMLSASFCGSPPGKQDGDSDRFLPALLFGCIPVFFEHDGQREWRPLEGHPDVPWDAFSLRVRTRDIAQLHAVLGNISHARVAVSYTHLTLPTTPYV